jgi:hypothetical protein
LIFTKYFVYLRVHGKIVNHIAILTSKNIV